MTVDEMLLLATVPESQIRVRRTPARARRPAHIVRGMRIGGAAADEKTDVERLAPTLLEVWCLAPKRDEAESEAANAAQWCWDPHGKMYAWDRHPQARKGYGE